MIMICLIGNKLKTLGEDAQQLLAHFYDQKITWHTQQRNIFKDRCTIFEDDQESSRRLTVEIKKK